MPGDEVTVLERHERPGNKLYATGGGRCNLTNVNAEYYEETKAFFESLGVPFYIDSEGRAYPYSEKSGSVVNALFKECERLSVKIICNTTVLDIKRNEEGFSVFTTGETYRAGRVVIAAGGAAQPSLGGNGSAFKLAEALGHSIVQPVPGLVPLTSPTKRIRALSGIRAKCRVSIELGGKIVGEDEGELLFTDYGISGIVVMNLSNIISRNFASENPMRCRAFIDFVPQMAEEELLKYSEKFGDFSGILGSEISAMLFSEAGNDAALAAKYAKHQAVIINGTRGFNFAQITCGGVPESELSDFASLKCPGLYLCGEVIDRQYECGGFNLDFAWHSGIAAAKKIAEGNEI